MKTVFRFPFTLNDSAVMYGGFQGGPQLGSPLMPRDASLSDSYKSVGDGFPVRQSFHAEKTIFSFPFTLNDSAVIYGGFQGGSQLGPHDAERR